MEKAKTHISTHKIWKINEKYLAKNANELGAYTTRAFACIRPHCTHTHTPVHIATAADESQKIPKKKGTANQAHTHTYTPPPAPPQCTHKYNKECIEQCAITVFVAIIGVCVVVVIAIVAVFVLIQALAIAIWLHVCSSNKNKN